MIDYGKYILPPVNPCKIRVILIRITGYCKGPYVNDVGTGMGEGVQRKKMKKGRLPELYIAFADLYQM